MTLQIKHEKSGDVAVLQCAGRIVRGNALCTLREAVTMQENVRIIVLDLSEVEMLDRTRLTCVFDISSVDDAVGILCSADRNGDSKNLFAA